MSNNTGVTIDIWSDYACPFCWIGKKNLETALDSLDLGSVEARKEKNITINYRSFLLNPASPLTPEQAAGKGTYYEYLQKTKGWSPEQRQQIFGSMTQRGKGMGLDFNFDNIKLAGTQRGHLLLKVLQKKYGTTANTFDVAEKLFEGYFKNGVDFKDSMALLQYTGLLDTNSPLHVSPDELEASVAAHIAQSQGNNNIQDEVVTSMNLDLAQARQYRITGVPFFVFNNKTAVSGAQPPEVLAQAIGQSMKQ